jgi:hypothetical protein
MVTGTTNQSLLRWYPVRWQARYGEEFAAMIEDDLEGGLPTLRYQWPIARTIWSGGRPTIRRSVVGLHRRKLDDSTLPC